MLQSIDFAHTKYVLSVQYILVNLVISCVPRILQYSHSLYTFLLVLALYLCYEDNWQVLVSISNYLNHLRLHLIINSISAKITNKIISKIIIMWITEIAFGTSDIMTTRTKRGQILLMKS